MDRIRLLIAEDETMVRHALAYLLGAEADVDVVGQAPNGEAAVALATDLRPDVVLMDLNMPRMDGIEATRRIRQGQPDCAVVVLTVLDDEPTVFAAIKAGATSYVLKDAPPEQTLAAVRAAARGEGFLHSALVPAVLSEFARVSDVRAEGRQVFAELTRRELEVLELVGSGLRNRQIAERLYLSEKTVKNHITSILAKLHLNGRTEAALLAARHGLVEE